jgi:hypothetical protein
MSKNAIGFQANQTRQIERSPGPAGPMPAIVELVKAQREQLEANSGFAFNDDYWTNNVVPGIAQEIRTRIDLLSPEVTTLTLDFKDVYVHPGPGRGVEGGEIKTITTTRVDGSIVTSEIRRAVRP